MDLDFNEALKRIGPDAIVRIARELKPPSRFLFNQFLPEVNQTNYVAESGNMTVRSTMAGLSAMDSPYPPGGRVEASDFQENIAKVANEVTLNERTQRQLQDRLIRLQLLGGGAGGGTIEAMVQEVLNFTNKAVLQPHFDTAEWLRSRAIMFGEIDWTFNQKRLLVDYGVPATNFLAEKTGATGYGAADSSFWSDIRALRRILRYNVRTFVAHPETIDMIVSNPANNLVITAQEGFNFTIRKVVAGVAGGQVESTDARDGMQLLSYQEEGEMVDPSNPEGRPLIVPFMPMGKILALGNNSRSGYRVGEGSTEDPEADRALGYTHIGPTVEGSGATGRWSDVFTPERRKYQLVGQGVTNLLPVIEAPEKIAVATTEMA